MLRILIPNWLYILILIHAEVNHLPTEVVMAVIWTESSFRPEAVGDAGRSFGLMQLHLDGAGHGHQPAELLDAASNLRIGCQYLATCLEATSGSLPDAVSCYNQGIAGWRKRGRVVNQQFVNIVMERARKLRPAEIETYSAPLDVCKVYIQEV